MVFVDYHSLKLSYLDERHLSLNYTQKNSTFATDRTRQQGKPWKKEQPLRSLITAAAPGKGQRQKSLHLYPAVLSALLSGTRGKLKPPRQSRLWRQATGPEEPPLSVSTFPSGQKGHLNQGSGHTALHKAAKGETQLSTVYTETVLLGTEDKKDEKALSFRYFLVPFSPIFPSRPPQLYRFLTVLPLDH